MSLMDLFKPIPSLEAGEVRRLIDRSDPGEYNLIDVRQPKEYEKEHLPGARLIPLSELNDRLGEIDSDKKTITY